MEVVLFLLLGLILIIAITTVMNALTNKTFNLREQKDDATIKKHYTWLFLPYSSNPPDGNKKQSLAKMFQGTIFANMQYKLFPWLWKLVFQLSQQT